MALLLRIVRSVLGIPRRFRRLITSQKKSEDYKFHVAIGPARQGVSPQVLEMLGRIMEEYKEDLDYLKDR